MFPLGPSVQSNFQPKLETQNFEKKAQKSPGSEGKEEMDKPDMNIWGKYHKGPRKEREEPENAVPISVWPENSTFLLEKQSAGRQAVVTKVFCQGK